jgi:stress-induced morphogen
LAYSKSIKDRLLVYVEDNNVTFCIFSKDGNIVFKKKILFTGEDQLVQELDSNEHLNQPFFDITLLLHAHSYTLFPHTHESPGNTSSLYQLSNKLEPHLSLLDEALTENIEIHYTISEAIFKTIKNKFSASKVISDVSLIHEYNKETESEFPIRMYAGVFNNQLQVHCYQRQELVYSNKYPVQNSEDVFYFMMLGAEVFKLNLNDAHLTWLSEPEAFRVQVHELLQNYIRQITQFPIQEEGISPLIEIYRACE